MDHLQIGLAFVEGLALIASPCILPVLPLVLSASVDGGKARPFGIITGFVLSFSLFVLLSRKLVNAFHINLDIIKDASLVLLFLFGLVLLSAKLSEKFSNLTQGAAALGSKFTAGENKGGYLSGVIIGALIGLIWTPCAGPILAAVLVQVILQKSDLSALFIVMSFAIGAGVPMLVIALVGRKVMGKLGFFTRHAEAVRKVFGVIMILTVVYLGFGGSSAVNGATAPATSPQVMADSGPLMLQNGLKKPYPAPDFAGITQWLNSNPLMMKELKGKVVLVDFWTYSCINCVRTLPYVTAWDEKYRDKGLVIIGVHSPEFEFEKNAENVKTALQQHGIKYPVALDNELATWQNFNNSYWPAHYLINRDGNVVYTHFGEGDYDVTENNIRYLLGLSNKVQDVATVAEHPVAKQTPETYLGYDRAANNRNKKIKRDAESNYQFAANLPVNSWSLNGGWKVGAEKITATKAGAALCFNFNARKVFLVLGTASGSPVKVKVTLNGAALGDNAGKDLVNGELTVKNNTLYELIDQHSGKNAVAQIVTEAPGLEAYAFTFGG